MLHELTIAAHRRITQAATVLRKSILQQKVQASALLQPDLSNYKLTTNIGIAFIIKIIFPRGFRLHAGYSQATKWT